MCGSPVDGQPGRETGPDWAATTERKFKGVVGHQEPGQTEQAAPRRVATVNASQSSILPLHSELNKVSKLQIVPFHYQTVNMMME